MSKCINEECSFHDYKMTYNCGGENSHGDPYFLNCTGKILSENKYISLLKEINEYLNTNDLTTIGHGSKLHNEIKYILGE